MPAEIVRVDQFGLLTTGLRNIRCDIDGRAATFELVPEQLLPPDVTTGGRDPIVSLLTQGASRVVEGRLALRLEFSHLVALAADNDVDVDLFGGLQTNWAASPRLEGSRTFYPLLEIRNSAWKAQLPEWRRRDDPDVRHIRMISAECSFDVLGELVSGVWVANSHAE